MSFVLSPSSTTVSPSCNNLSSNFNPKLITNLSSNLNCKLFFNSSRSPASPLLISSTWRNSPSRTLNFTCKDATITNLDLEDPVDIDWEDENMVGSPWEGALVYRRDPSMTHLEYCTTLERLGLGKLSTEVSKSRASAMGLRVTKAVKDYPLGTPVLVSVDVCRKKRKLRLDGIIRTVLTLGCNRCGEPAAECVYSNFTLLLTEEPIEEAEVIDMGIIFGEDRRSGSGASNGDKEEEEEDDDDTLIDLDDRLYFPAESKEIDISKNIRDLVHIEITINAICDPKCKGLCLKCGANLNTGVCNCSRKQVQKEKSYGPLGNLRERLQQK